MFWIGGIPKPNIIENPRKTREIERLQKVVKTRPVAERLLKAYVEPVAQQARPVLLVSDLMSRQVFTLGPEDTTERARQLCLKHNIHHVPILQDSQLVGIVSDRDLLRAVAREQKEGPLLLGAIMTQRVLACDANTTIREVAGVMAQSRVHGVPVIDSERHLVGLITVTDILACLVNNAPLDLWT